VPEPVNPEQSEAPRPALPQPVPTPPAAVVQEPPRPAPPPASVRAPPPPRRVVARPTLAEHVPEARSRITNAPGPAEPPAATSAAPAGSTSASASAQQVTPTGLDPAWLEGVGAWLLAHRSYPEMARALGRQGTVVVQITVDANGHVEDVNVVRGSGSESLDHAAEALVRNARLPPFPADMKQPRQSVTIPVRYRLE
ncbi:MAG: periplasmic protein TonB, partial [Acetobacteraceae bacterium]|nr:periplasmic protein TonB [Acetobacteraceae bacterium]